MTSWWILWPQKLSWFTQTSKYIWLDENDHSGVSNGFGMPSFDPITEKPKKTPGDQVAEVINRLVAQRRNPNGVRPHIVVVAPLHDPNRKSKTTARPSSAASKTTRTSSGKSTTTTKTTIRTTVKPKSNRKSGSTTRHPKTTTKKVVERTTEAIMTTSEFPTAIPILSKDAETLLAAAHVLAAKHKMMRNDEEEDVQHKEASEASQQFQKFEAVIDVPQEPHYINRQPYPVYQFEPITQSPSYQNVPSSSPPVSISSYHGPQEYHRSSYHHPTNHHAKKQHSSSRMGPAPSPSPAASHNMPIHVHPTQIIPTSLPTPLPSGPPPIIPQLYIQNENPRHQPPQFGAPQLHPPQMNQQPVHHFHTVHHPYPQQPHPQGGQQVPQTFMVNPYGLNGPVPPGQLLQMQSQIQQQLQQMQLQPNAPRPMMGPQLFNGHNQPNINNQINLNHNNQQQQHQQQQSQQNQGQYTASGSDVNPYMSRPNEEESDDSESVVSNTGITMNGNQGDGSSPTGMISVSSNEPAPSYQQQVAQESSPSKGLTLHFGGGPVGGGGQLVTSPVGIFKTLLLPLLPKPRVNLNGKVVFGVVLEKGVGFGKQKPSMVSFRPSHLYRLGRQWDVGQTSCWHMTRIVSNHSFVIPELDYFMINKWFKIFSRIFPLTSSCTSSHGSGDDVRCWCSKSSKSVLKEHPPSSGGNRVWHHQMFTINKKKIYY